MVQDPGTKTGISLHEGERVGSVLPVIENVCEDSIARFSAAGLRNYERLCIFQGRAGAVLLGSETVVGIELYVWCRVGAQKNSSKNAAWFGGGGVGAQWAMTP